MPFKLHDLTDSAQAWVRGEIGYFPGGIRDQLLARDWTGVRLFAWLPADLPAGLTHPLDASFVARLGKEHTIDWSYAAAEIGYVQAHLLRGGAFLYQTHYFRAEKGHPIARAPSEQLIAFPLGPRGPKGKKEEIWLYLDRDLESSGTITLTMHRGIWPQHGLGLLTSRPSQYPEMEGKELGSSSIMAELSASTQSILVPAWRGDAFIFVEWRSPKCQKRSQVDVPEEPWE